LGENGFLDDAGTAFMRGIQIAAFLFGAWTITGCAHVPQRIAQLPDPLSAAEHVMLGDAYQRQGEKSAALQQYQLALDEDRRQVRALLALGNAAFDSGDWPEARAYFRLAQKASPDNPGVMNNLAMVDLAEGKPLTVARQKLEQALPTAGPATPYILDTLAAIALREGRYADAQYALVLAQDAAPSDDPDFANHLKASRDKLVNRRLTHVP
jgi:tetratricopeptide (TPR) repeat protein